MHRLRNIRNYSKLIDIKPEVSEALKTNNPIVALESTIITHGMPYPQNIETALEVENIVRSQVKVSSINYIFDHTPFIPIFFIYEFNIIILYKN